MTNIDQAVVDQIAKVITDALVGCDLRTTKAAVYGGNVAAGAVTPLIAEAVERAERRVRERVEAVHRPQPEVVNGYAHRYCMGCWAQWPCQTARALTEGTAR